MSVNSVKNIANIRIIRIIIINCLFSVNFQKESQCIINEYLILKEDESVQDPFVVCGQMTCGPGGQVILKR